MSSQRKESRKPGHEWLMMDALPAADVLEAPQRGSSVFAYKDTGSWVLVLLAWKQQNWAQWRRTKLVHVGRLPHSSATCFIWTTDAYPVVPFAVVGGSWPSVCWPICQLPRHPEVCFTDVLGPSIQLSEQTDASVISRLPYHISCRRTISHTLFWELHYGLWAL